MVNPSEKDKEYVSGLSELASGDYEEVYSIGDIQIGGEKFLLKAQSFLMVRIK